MRAVANHFESRVASYFAVKDEIESRSGYSGQNTLAAVFEGVASGTTKHKILSHGIPMDMKALNRAYCAMESNDRAMLWLAYGIGYLNGKRITKKQRAESAGMSVYEFDSATRRLLRDLRSRESHFLTQSRADS